MASPGPRPPTGGRRGPPLPSFSQGRGRPVVFLPGLSLSPGPPRGSARLLESALVAPLSRRHRVHWIGRRSGLPADVTTADLAADVAEHMRDRFDGPLPVIGFSTGGFVALQLAIDHPDVVASLVVVGAGARLSDRTRVQEQRLRDLLERGLVRESWQELAGDVLGPRLGRLLGPGVATVSPGGSPEAALDAAAVCRADLAFDASGQLRRITAPTLLVVGMRDAACDPALALRTRAGIPGAQLVLLPGTGHLGSMVSPRATRRVGAFLAGRAATRHADAGQGAAGPRLA